MAGAQAARVVSLLAERTGTRAEDWHLVFKARYGLQVAFATMARLGDRTHVATQVFTCVTAVDPITATGLTPRFLEVDEGRIALSASGLQAAEEPLLAVVDQHTYGIIDDAASRELAEAAHARGAWLVEDCAHCPGRLAMGEDGPVPDVSVHSFGVEKLLPHTRFGGAVWVNPAMESEALCVALNEALSALPPIPKKLEKAARAFRNQTRLLNRMPASMARRMGEKWVANGTREPAVASVELEGGLPLAPMAPGEWVSAQAVPDLEALDANLAARRKSVAAYSRGISHLAHVFVPGAALSAEHPQPLLRFPLFARTPEAADAIRGRVEALGLYCTKWYRPLLFPGSDLAAFGIEDFDAWPVSKRLSDGVVCLPTDLGTVEPGAVVEAVISAARDFL